MPGIFLIIVGVLNLLGAGILGFVGFSASQVPTAELQSQMEKQQPGNVKELQKAGLSVKDIQNWYLYGGGIGGCVGGLLAIPIILGGIAMCTRKAYGLAVIASILAAIPVLSPSACCIFGMAIGIWALVVLLNAEVKATFR
jgi:hypothetical protein